MCQSCVLNTGFQKSLPKLKLSLFCTFDLSLSLFMFLVACFQPSQCLHFAPLTLHSIQLRKRDLLCFCHWNCMLCEQWPAASSKALRAWPVGHSRWGVLSPGLVRVSAGRQELAVVTAWQWGKVSCPQLWGLPGSKSELSTMNQLPWLPASAWAKRLWGNISLIQEHVQLCHHNTCTTIVSLRLLPYRIKINNVKNQRKKLI